MTITEIRALVAHITLDILGTKFTAIVQNDQKYFKVRKGNIIGRTYIQLQYVAPCTKTGRRERFKGGKHYLSSHMTEDEIVKKVYVAFEQAVKHELMEGFKFDGKIVFNPHTSFRDLLTVSHKEVKREVLSITHKGHIDY